MEKRFSQPGILRIINYFANRSGINVSARGHRPCSTCSSLSFYRESPCRWKTGEKSPTFEGLRRESRVCLMAVSRSDAFASSSKYVWLGIIAGEFAGLRRKKCQPLCPQLAFFHHPEHKSAEICSSLPSFAIRHRSKVRRSIPSDSILRLFRVISVVRGIGVAFSLTRCASCVRH